MADERRERICYRLRRSVHLRAVIEAARRDEYLYEFLERAIEAECSRRVKRSDSEKAAAN